MKAVDYRALTTKITEADLAAYKKLTGDRWMTISETYMWVTVLAALAGLVTAIVGAILRMPGIVVQFGVVFGIGWAVVSAILSAIVENTRARVQLHKFAEMNHARYVFKQKDIPHTGMIFNKGHSRVIQHGITFSDGIEVGEYRYTTGSGKSQQIHIWGFLMMKLPRRLPNMVLDTKKNNFLSVVTNLPDEFKNGQKLSLEGDFDKYFTLYAPQEYARDALYIFTPDVMQAAMDSEGAYDMEVVDDRFYIYAQTNYALVKEKNIKALMDIAKKVGGEIAEQGSYYADERVGNREANVVAPLGQRLKTGTSIGVGIGMAVYIIYMIVRAISEIH
ncbi:hypothetical protein KBD87_00030 [Candidatus Saccharibacteria bacterium]|nr:hypothetical protein [Candidatus Saccharibacteria bacterium]